MISRGTTNTLVWHRQGINPLLSTLNHYTNEGVYGLGLISLHHQNKYGKFNTRRKQLQQFHIRLCSSQIKNVYEVYQTEGLAVLCKIKSHIEPVKNASLFLNP
jgi:hypothetical protein